MRNIFAIGFLLILSHIGFAQKDTTQLVYFNELKFNSDSEKQYYTSLLEDAPVYFELLASLDSTTSESDISSYLGRFDIVLNNITGPKWEKKKPEKRVKAIYEEIHSSFFDQYNLENNFADVFAAGKYNCVSATGIYALALEKLDIPYIIKEEPTHVYLIAYPNSEQIIIEATNPAAGYTQYNASFKKDFIDRLIKVKLIGSVEAQQLSTDQLFNKYYYTQQNIGLRELVALQYYNDALYKMNEKNFEYAFSQLEKAYLLYESERIGYLLYLNGTSLLDKLSPEDPAYIPMVLKISRYINYGVKDENLISEYKQQLQLNLFDKGGIENNEQLYVDFKEVLQDSSSKNTISYIYSFETGRYYFSKGKYSQALEFVSQAYSLKPNDTRSESFMVSIIAQKANRTGDIEKVYTLLNDFKEDYPTLIGNENFKLMLVRSNLEMASFYFYTNKGNQAKTYLLNFEEFDTKEFAVDKNAVSKAYVSAAMYYYKKGYTSKALTQVSRGLKYIPNDYNLLRIKNMMK